MRWILTVPDTFVLTRVLQRSRWLQQPPFAQEQSSEHLRRVERLLSGHAVVLTVSQASAGLILEINERLKSKDVEEISHKTWRMLRLGEDLQPFLNLVHQTPELGATRRYGATLLRGATLFEDVIKAVVFTKGKKSQLGQRAAWIVDHFGDPLPTNPTRHAFPLPEQLVTKQSALNNVFEPAVAEKLAHIAAIFHTQAGQIKALTDPRYDLEHLAEGLTQLVHLDDAELGMVMLSLGRYDYIPVDRTAQEHVGQYIENRVAGPHDIRALFEPFQPWGGLAYWLWDWSLPPAGNGATLWKA